MTHMSGDEDLRPEQRGGAPKQSLRPSTTVAKVGVGTSLAGAGLGGIALVLATPIESGQGTTIGGLAVLVGAALTFYSAKLTRDQTRHDENAKLAEQQLARDQSHQREVTRDLQSRFTNSATQLADNAATIRLAGVYSLASLADDWYAATGSTLASERDRQVCIDVLCAYLRRDTTAYSELFAQLKEGDIVGRTDALKAEEMIVRDAVITALRAHTTFVPDVTNDPSWRGANFDLTGAKLGAAYLQALDLATALLPGADLIDARLIGTRLNSCNLDGTIFVSAHLNGAQLIGAHVNKAQFNHARLDGTNFQNATGRAADFTDAKGDLTVFLGARLHSAKFIRAQLSGAHFDGAYLNDANFEGANLTHACFDGATIDGTDFSGVDLTTASFNDVSIRWDEPVWPNDKRPDHVTVTPIEEFPDPNND